MLSRSRGLFSSTELKSAIVPIAGKEFYHCLPAETTFLVVKKIFPRNSHVIGVETLQHADKLNLVNAGFDEMWA